MGDLLRAIAENPTRTHGLDINWLDLRHPWKTNEADLAATLTGAGMKDVTLYRRSAHANNTKCAVALSLEQCRQRENRARMVYGIVLRPAIGLLKAVFGANPPRKVARLVFWTGQANLVRPLQAEMRYSAGGFCHRNSCRHLGGHQPFFRSMKWISGRDLQALGGGLGGDVALGHAEHFEANHIFADGGRAQRGG